MSKNNLMAIALLGMIIGASGLGLGAYTIIQVQSGAFQGENGEDGNDGNDGITTTIYVNFTEYPCSSELDINNAFNDIGTGSGIITIIDNITLSDTINIDGGGSYIIQGQGLGTSIDVNWGDRTAFYITNAKSCKIQNLKIDADVINQDDTAIIFVNELNDNPVYINNIQIKGAFSGIGIYIYSDNVWIEDCLLDSIYKGIYQFITAKDAYFSENKITNCDDFGMEIRGSYNSISDNYFFGGIDWAIQIDGSFNSISNNKISDCEDGINIDGNNNTIVNNIINKIDVGHGIFLEDSDGNVISGNSISNLLYGGITLSSSHYNTIHGNSIRFSKTGGISLAASDYNSISGNFISDIYNNVAFNISGIEINSLSDYNTITGNGCFRCVNSHLSYDGYGLFIRNSNCNQNIVVGNTSLENEQNFKDNGTDTTVGSNNFS